MNTKNFNPVLLGDNYKKALKSAFTSKDIELIDSLLIKCYSFVHSYIHNDAPELLRSPIAPKIYPMLKDIELDMLLDHACKRGELGNWQSKYVPVKGNGDKYLLLSGTAINGYEYKVTVNQTRSPKNHSRKAVFRKKLNQNFQPRLNLFGEEDKSVIDLHIPVYLELNHGFQSVVPKFLVLGMPISSEWHYESLYNKDDQIKQLDNPEANDILESTKLTSKDIFEDFIIKKDKRK